MLFYIHMMSLVSAISFFFNDTATTEIYTLSLHDALPICSVPVKPLAPHEAMSVMTGAKIPAGCDIVIQQEWTERNSEDRKSTRLNSSHSQISYAVFCLKKKHR